MRFSSLSAKLSVLAIATVASSLAIGCSDTNTGPTTGGTGVTAGTNPNAGAVPEGFELTCRATVSPATFDFEADGTTLTMTVGGQSQTLTREPGTSGTTVLGTWSLPTSINGDPAYIARMGLAIHATAVVTSSSITTLSDCSSNWATIHARVSSPITISGSTLSILEGHTQDRKWTAAGGDQVTSTTSFRPFGDAPTGETATVLSAEFPGF